MDEIVAGDKPELERLKDWYREEIARRDRIIEELRKENLLLVRSSIKTSERLAELQQAAQGEAKWRVSGEKEVKKKAEKN